MKIIPFPLKHRRNDQEHLDAYIRMCKFHFRRYTQSKK